MLDVHTINIDVLRMITASQLRAARMMLAIDQRGLAERSGLSLPTIQRMEASHGLVRGHMESPTRVVRALEAAGIELIANGALSTGGGQGVRLKATFVKHRHLASASERVSVKPA